MIVLGGLLIVAAAVVLIAASASTPSPGACRLINHINQQFGGSHCQSGPTHAQYVLAAGLAIAGVVCLLARYVRGHN